MGAEVDAVLESTRMRADLDVTDSNDVAVE
jgi:hypothetical protein